MELQQSLLFLKKFINNPKQIGSIWPSSRFLAEKMVRHVQWNDVKAIAELGSGTGAITRAITSSVSNGTKVFLFEKDEAMMDMLQAKFPYFTHHSNACKLTAVIKQQGINQIDCVISGLPFFNFTKELRQTLIDQIVCALKPGGYFIAFQYSLQMKEELSKFFVIEKIDFVPFNAPPAFVYVCRKKELNSDQLLTQAN